MIFQGNIAFPNGYELFNGMVHSYISDNISLYESVDMDCKAYILVEVGYMLNLLYECQNETKADIIAFGNNILHTAITLKSHYQMPDSEREYVRSICLNDNVSEKYFSLNDACVCGQKGCELYQDVINNTWAIYIDGVQLHCFVQEKNAKLVFEYIKRDVRQSSDKWLSIIEGNPTRF